MGIHGLSRLIADITPEAIKDIDLKSLFGRRIAIDASMCLYQFLIAIRSSEYAMTNDQGETTSHLVGMFYRTIKFLENGIKPVYVFDGKAPQLKCGELEKRTERRTEAKDKLEDAKETQNIEEIQKLNKRLVKVTRKHSEDCKKLLQLLGIPIIQAPSEAEAQCAQLCKENLVYAVATEDMDALTFGCPRLIRNLTSSQNEKLKEFQIERVLDGLGIDQNQFIDLSILMGCDYCDNIKGIGGKKGLELIKKFKNIEGILKNKFGIEEFVDVEIEYNNRKIKEEIKDEIVEDQTIEAEAVDTNRGNDSLDQDEMAEEEENDADLDGTNGRKKPVPMNWPFKGARMLFQEPLVMVNKITETDLKMKDIDEEGIVKFLCEENGFSEDRVRKSLKRAAESKSKSSQTRIDSFFKLAPSNKSPIKRQTEDTKSKKSSTGAKRGRRPR
ncbi:dynein light chain Tctex-type 1 [Sarcoptes scabiei]|uniref:Flap endonuclease 1 n=1 Tax=Sarcoptes scabiei TaxID=52283 RepID=A0A132A620_SARSC|nr:flap endonuclease 1-like protein [Sarcoptes scabiei]UXI19511.1 dynein light chain Tctex-type 1 [Sarcoptes scabiei]